MNTERKSLMEIAAERDIKVNKFWSTEKLAKAVNAGIATKERRSDAMRRAWDHRRTLFGQTGCPSKPDHSSAEVESVDSEKGEPSTIPDNLVSMIG